MLWSLCRQKGCLAGMFETSYTSVWNFKCQILTLEPCFLGCPHFLSFTIHGQWSEYINIPVKPSLKSQCWNQGSTLTLNEITPICPSTAIVKAPTSNHSLICQSWVQIPAQALKSFCPRPYHHTSWSGKIIATSISLDLCEDLIR